METVPAIRPPLRPACPRHPGSRVRLDGYVRCGWSDAHRRPLYRCVTEPGTRGHAVSLPVPVRQPTERHPDSGAACPRCEHVYERHEGVRTGIDFTVSVEASAEAVQREVDDAIGRVRQWIAFVSPEVETFNAQLPASAQGAVDCESRRSELIGTSWLPSAFRRARPQ